jgi:hypothetical protein
MTLYSLMHSPVAMSQMTNCAFYFQIGTIWFLWHDHTSHCPFALSLPQSRVINLFAYVEAGCDPRTTKPGIVLAAQWVTLSLRSWMNLRCICRHEIRGLPLMGQVSPRTERRAEAVQLLRWQTFCPLKKKSRKHYENKWINKHYLGHRLRKLR